MARSSRSQTRKMVAEFLRELLYQRLELALDEAACGRVGDDLVARIDEARAVALVLAVVDEAGR